VWIHGGGWVSGDKRGAESYPLLQTLYRKNGWVIVALNFRYAGSGPEGACYGPIEDLGAALRWIQQEGSAYGADPENVTLVGHSSGAHLASLYLAQEQRQHAGQRSYQRVLSIRACVFISGIYDLEQWLAEPSKGGTHRMGTYFHDLAMCVLMPRHWLVTSTSSRRRTSIMVAQADGGTSPDGALLEAVSPCGCLAHAWNMHSGGDQTRRRALLPLPPALLVHGSSDPFTPASQADSLAAIWRRTSPCGVAVIPGCHGLLEIGSKWWATLLPCLGAQERCEAIVSGCVEFMQLHCSEGAAVADY
jgi:acetyl esterase/lipase